MIIFGMCGTKMVGKDSFADIAFDIGRKGDFGMAKIALATPLKSFCVTYLGLQERQCFGTDDEKNEIVGTWGEFIINQEILDRYDKQPEHDMSAREVLQIVGTDFFRENFSGDFWLGILARRIEQKDFDDTNGIANIKVVFVTDVRFPNEIEGISKLGKLIRLYRKIPGKTESIQHASENSLDTIPEAIYDHIIDADQNKNLKQLKANVIRILNLEEVFD